MDYGIGIPSWINAYEEVQRAEAAGFTHAWFYDSQLIYSDVYAAMALAAHHTSTIKLGTLVAIPSNRIAPVTASAVASLNKLAPGRIILGIGTGYTGRNTMGLPAYPIKRYREYAQQVRGLLDGEDVRYTDDVTGEERWIRLIHGHRSEFLNLDNYIPIYVAANGPRAMEVVGQVGDGWVTTGMGLNARAGLSDDCSGGRSGGAFDREALYGRPDHRAGAAGRRGLRLRAGDAHSRSGHGAGRTRDVGGGLRTGREPGHGQPRPGRRVPQLHP